MFDTAISNRASQINEAMGRVYGYMGLSVFVSMVVSYIVGSTPSLVHFFFTGIMKWVVILAPLGFIFIIPMLLNSGIGKLGKILTLLTFSALMGLSFATIFTIYKIASIFTAFMGASVLFGVMSFYGYFTKKSLDSIGKWCFIGLIAIIIASLINIFIGSTITQMVISAISIIIFLGLTAYDTQRIRESLIYSDDDSVEISGALTLYLNFINLFINLLQLFGIKRDE